jgi:CheY-like chemotaxis protein
MAMTDSKQTQAPTVIDSEAPPVEPERTRGEALFPSLDVVVGDLEGFVSKGAGFWRAFGIDFEALPSLAVVVERESREAGPDARNQAIEDALRAAIADLEMPMREAAEHFFGFSQAGRDTKGKTARGNLAANALHMDGRSFRRKRDRGGESSSTSDELIEAVAKKLLQLEASGATGDDPRPLLLYVEDTEAYMTLAREALPDYRVVCVDTLGKAINALVHDGPFALVLVDPNLTDLEEGDGLEVLEYLRERMPEVPRVVVTGSRFAGAITRNLGERYGVFEILIKGDYTLPDLRSTVDRAVRKFGDRHKNESGGV